MTFEVERIDLTDGKGAVAWERAPTRRCDAAFGRDAQSALAAVVARDGGVQLGVAATFRNGQAVMLARKGEVVYALRAFPRAMLPMQTSNVRCEDPSNDTGAGKTFSQVMPGVGPPSGGG